MLGTTFRLHNKRLTILLFLLLMLLLAACGGGASSDTPEEPQAESPDSESSTEDQTAEERETDSSGGTLRVAMQPIVNIDPINISSDSEILVANHVYDYLVDIDPQSNIIPRLATEWRSTDGGSTYVFTLADGVKWHDGSEFSAADVVWTYERLRSTEGTPTADLFANIESIEATGDLEVTFKLAKPNSFFLYDLSDNHALILKEGTSDADSNFNGTGPFIVEQYSPEDRIEMVANEDYFIEGQPNLDRLEIIFFNDDAAAVDALIGGQIDLAMRMPTALFVTLQQEPGINTHSIPTNGFDLVRLRSDREPGNDPRVMQALKLATDREAIFNVVQQGFGAIGNDTPIGPLYEAYFNPDVAPPARDVEAAKALLAEAGYDESNPLILTLHTPDTGGRPDLAAVLKEQWAEAGVEIEISVEPESVYYGDEGWLEVDLGITGWGSRPYPQFYLETMLVTDAKWNESHFSDEEFDRLVTTAGTTVDDSERVKAYRQIQQLLVDRGPIMVPYFFAQLGAISDQFDDFEMKAFAGRTDFREIKSGGS
ncbi:MAG: ABC transporter substrate-binding protein [Candidatus Promineifilaceae bacterium]|nr:ABC transporter substrate-binding protein [Candidatus Promineifilaceae bacterium]